MKKADKICVHQTDQERLRIKESVQLDRCFDNLVSKLVDLIEQRKLGNIAEEFQLDKLVDSDAHTSDKEVMEKVLIWSGLDKIKNEQQLKRADIYQLAWSLHDQKKSQPKDVMEEKESEIEDKENDSDKKKKVLPAERLDNTENLAEVAEVMIKEKKIEDLRARLAVNTQVDVIDEDIKDDFDCLTDFLLRKDGKEYDIVGKEKVDIDHMAKEVQNEDPERLTKALQACFNVAQHYFIKHRRQTDQLSWEQKFILRQISQGVFDKKEYREFWKNPEGAIIKMGDLKDPQRSKYERMLELAGMDTDHIFDLAKISLREELSILGIRENFLNDFHGRVLFDLQQQRPNDFRENSFKLKSVAFLAAAAAVRMFEWQAIKFINQKNYKKDSIHEYVGVREGRLGKWIPKIWLTNKLKTKRMNQLCEEWVDKIMIGKQEKLSEKEIIISIFGQRMNTKNEMTQLEQALFHEAMARAEKQRVLNRKYKAPKIRRKKYAEVVNMDVEDQYADWLQDKIELDNGEQSVNFAWKLLEEKYDARIERMMRQIRVKGKHHALFLSGELQHNAGVDYRNICKKTWKNFLSNLI